MDEDLLENTAEQVEERLRGSCLTFSKWDEIEGLTAALTAAFRRGPKFARLSTMKNKGGPEKSQKVWIRKAISRMGESNVPSPNIPDDLFELMSNHLSAAPGSGVTVPRSSPPPQPTSAPLSPVRDTSRDASTRPSPTISPNCLLPTPTHGFYTLLAGSKEEQGLPLPGSQLL